MLPDHPLHHAAELLHPHQPVPVLVRPPHHLVHLDTCCCCIINMKSYVGFCPIGKLLLYNNEHNVLVLVLSYTFLARATGGTSL